MSKPVVFLASFPPIHSAIKIGSEGARVQFDIPESEMGNAVHLLAMRNVVLKVTVEIAKGEKGNGEEEEKGVKPR